MLKKLITYILLVFLGATGYFLLNYHIIFSGTSFKLLHKSKLTSEYTFINTSNKSVESLMRIDTLREAGIGNVLVEMGRLNEEERKSLEQKFNSDPVYY
jgi:preprotein translocase subunit Sec63